MKTYRSVHVHSCFAGWSSEDITMYKEIQPKERTDEMLPHLNVVQVIKLKEKTKIHHDGNTFFVHNYEDNTFYEKGLHSPKPMLTHFKDTPEFKALIATYEKLGYSQECPKELQEAQDADYARREAKETVRRKRQGFVLPNWIKNRPVKDFQGGFSDKVFNDSFLQKYIGNGVAFGYIGHSVRTFKLDKVLESEFAKLPPHHQISMRSILCQWLSSSYGRHFGDSLEGLSLSKQTDLICKNISSIFDLGMKCWLECAGVK